MDDEDAASTKTTTSCVQFIITRVNSIRRSTEEKLLLVYKLIDVH